MDPRFYNRRGYDADLLILRSLFALNPVTNLPISTNFILTSDGIGGLEWQYGIQWWSTITSGVIFSSINLSTLSLYDSVTKLPDVLSASNGNLLLNGLPIVPGNGISPTELFSTIGGLAQAGYISSSQLTSTVTGLASAGFISSSQLTSSLTGLGSLGYVSSGHLASTVAGLGTSGYVSSSQLTSSLIGLGSINYLSSLSLLSTVDSILNPTSYISSGNLTSTSIGLYNIFNSNFNVDAISSFVVYGDVTFNSVPQISIGIQNIFIQDVSTLSTAVGTSLSNISVGIQGSFESQSTIYGSNTIGSLFSSQLFSTVTGLGTIGYISTSQLVSTVEGIGGTGLVSTGQLTSSLIGLASFGYVSTSQLTSTVQGLGGSGIITDSALTSSIQGLGTLFYISSSQLTSSLQGLGTIQYISTASLVSTTAGILTGNQVTQSQLTSTIGNLAFAGYVSSSQLTSSLVGISNIGYVNSNQLASTVVGLGTVNYISTSQLTSTVTNLVQTTSFLSISQFLYSTGSYISTGSLVSTTKGLKDSFFIVNANNVYILGGTAIISSTSNVVYISTFLNSSITYSGTNGNTTATGTAAQLEFSTASLRFDTFSSFINSNSRITIDYYPTFLFSYLGLPSSNPLPIYMSTFVKFGTNYFSTQIANSAFWPTEYTYSNSYSIPGKLTLPGSNVVNAGYTDPYVLNHNLPNAVTQGVTQGFFNSNVTVLFGSTNSLFLSIVNSP